MAPVGLRSVRTGCRSWRSCATLDPATRRARMEQLNTRVRETGIAYDLFSDPASTVQPWRVDLVPLMISPEEWRDLERGLLQRAPVRGACWRDLYGPQRLLAHRRHPARAGLQRSFLPAAVPAPRAAPAATSSSSRPTWRAAAMGAGG